MAGRKRYSSNQKLSIVLEGLRKDSSVIEICRRHGITNALFYKWREQFIQGGLEIFENQGKSAKAKAHQDKIRQLERLIGQQTIELEILKKTQEYLG